MSEGEGMRRGFVEEEGEGMPCYSASDNEDVFGVCGHGLGGENSGLRALFMDGGGSPWFRR